MRRRRVIKSTPARPLALTSNSKMSADVLVKFNWVVSAWKSKNCLSSSKNKLSSRKRYFLLLQCPWLRRWPQGTTFTRITRTIPRLSTLASSNKFRCSRSNSSNSGPASSSHKCKSLVAIRHKELQWMVAVHQVRASQTIWNTRKRNQIMCICNNSRSLELMLMWLR